MTTRTQPDRTRTLRRNPLTILAAFMALTILTTGLAYANSHRGSARGGHAVAVHHHPKLPLSTTGPAAGTAAGTAGPTGALGSASGAAAPNRVTMTCAVAPKGFDVRYHRKQVDSIVAYGQPLSAHMHDFYGRGQISSVMNSNWPVTPGHEEDPGYTPAYSTCLTYGDWAAYWFPTAKFNDAFIPVAGMLKVTYQSPAGSQVVTPPFGMTFVSGNAKATAAVENPRARFTCGGLDEPGFTIPTDCTSVAGGVVTAEVTFPDCWDGTKAFDTPAGISMSHFSYSAGGACASGSVPMAQLVTQQQFIDPRTNTPMVNPNNADGTLGLSFASGPYYTYHGDYINTWNHVLDTIVGACLNHDPYWANRAVCPTIVNNITIR
jgi:hypothetical protein